jgi:hypothetical protein
MAPCEDCGLKRASCGVPGDTKKTRWCVPCSRQHDGAQSVKQNTCEDCGLKQASCGVPGDTKKMRWCVPCSRQHEGAQSTQSMCEDCGLKQASCGVPGDTRRKRRWCGPCSQQHEGARNLLKRPRAGVYPGHGGMKQHYMKSDESIGQDCGYNVMAAQSTPATRRTQQLEKMQARLRTQQINVQDSATLAVVQARTNENGVTSRDEVERPAATRQTPPTNGVVTALSRKIKSDEAVASYRRDARELEALKKLITSKSEEIMAARRAGWENYKLVTELRLLHKEMMVHPHWTEGTEDPLASPLTLCYWV